MLHYLFGENWIYVIMHYSYGGALDLCYDSLFIRSDLDLRYDSLFIWRELDFYHDALFILRGAGFMLVICSGKLYLRYNALFI